MYHVSPELSVEQVNVCVVALPLPCVEVEGTSDRLGACGLAEMKGGHGWVTYEICRVSTDMRDA